MKNLYPDVDWQPVKEALSSAKLIHIVAHVSPDSDTMGSQIALYHLLTDLGKPVVMHNVDPVPRICMYLDGAHYITHGLDLFASIKADTVIAVDAGSRARLGVPNDYFDGKVVINIDHHASNICYGNVNMVDARYCATGAMIYDLIQSLNVSLNAGMASAIYAAVLTDTASFRMSTVTPDTHRMVANLLEAGASSEQAAQEIYQNFPRERFDLLQHALSTLDIDHDGATAWIHVPYHVYDEMGMSSEDSEGFIDYARSISGVVMAVFLREESVNEWKLSLRGKQGYDVGALAGQLGGGGHKYAAGCTLHGSFSEVRGKIYQAMRDHLTV